MPDRRGLSTRIEEALQNNDRLAGQPIAATVRKGVVKLRGMVESHGCKLLAQNIACSFGECIDVQNELVVKTRKCVPDEELAEAVRSALESHPDVCKEVVSVSVCDGVVTLSGNIVGEWERGAVENVTRKVRGVREVHNWVAVNLAKSMDDEGLCGDILAALAEEPGLGGGMVRVAVTNRVALLSGAVPALPHKELAEAVVQRLGISEIENEIIVTDA